MLINAIRFRSSIDAPWQAWRFSHGSGRLRSYLCFQGEPPLMHDVVAALNYLFNGTLTGPNAPRICEASLQLSDDAGDTWLIHRTPDKTRYMRNGETIKHGETERKLIAALLDVEPENLNPSHRQLAISTFELTTHEDKIERRVHGAPPSPSQNLRALLAKQMKDIAVDTAKLLRREELASPQILTSLTRQLEPLSHQYQEVCRQLKEVKAEDHNSIQEEATQAPRLKAEIELIEAIRQIAEPMLQPGSSTKNIREDLATVEAAISELKSSSELPQNLEPSSGRDFREAVETLARVEVYAKVIRALQRARKYCEHKVEPVFQKYHEAAMEQIEASTQIASELESCLASFELRARPSSSIRSINHLREEQAAAGLKSWFDRFKSRAFEQTSETAAQDDHDAHTSELETARMAIEYALNRFKELRQELSRARDDQPTPLQDVDIAHEELVKDYARCREQWTQIAQEFGIDAQIDLPRFVSLLGHHGQLLSLYERRQTLRERLRMQGENLTKLERLITDWRKHTGSQKLSDLSTPSILLSEARDLLRYQDARKAKLSQLQQRSQEDLSLASLRTLLIQRRDQLQTAWDHACKQHGLAALAMNDEHLPDMFRSSNLLKALALVHGSAENDKPQNIFSGLDEASIFHMFLWNEATLANKHRLEFLQQIEDADADGLRLLFIADEGLAGMLSSIGVGIATPLTVTPSVVASTPEPGLIEPSTTAPPSPTPTLPRSAGAKPVPQKVIKQEISKTVSRSSAQQPPLAPPREPSRVSQKTQEQLLNERARRALDLLTTKRPF